MLRPWGKGGVGGLQAQRRDSLLAPGSFQPSDSISPFHKGSTVPWGFLPASHWLDSVFKSRERVPKVAQQELSSTSVISTLGRKPLPQARLGPGLHQVAQVKGELEGEVCLPGYLRTSLHSWVPRGAGAEPGKPPRVGAKSWESTQFPGRGSTAVISFSET